MIKKIYKIWIVLHYYTDYLINSNFSNHQIYFSFTWYLFFYFRAPMTTGTSVVGIQFKNGILIATDILGSYGSLARYRNLERVMKVNDNIILGAGGDYADYQCLKSHIERKMYISIIFS